MSSKRNPKRSFVTKKEINNYILINNKSKLKMFSYHHKFLFFQYPLLNKIL